MYILFYHPTLSVSRIGVENATEEEIKKYGNYRYFGKVIEDRGYEYLVRCKYRYPNMTSTARMKMSVPKGWNVLKVFNYD
jgi:hypothetical protein